MFNRAVSVSELTAYLQGILETDPQLQDVWVVGEIANLRRPASGHLYFTLRDMGAALRCVMFRRQCLQLAFGPVDGLAVTARGSISLYRAEGYYELNVRELHPVGAGDLYLAWQQLKDKLAAEGLFASERKRRVPFWPRCIGLVTSPSGAALRDMVTIIQRRMPGTEVILAPARVQGVEAPAEICAGLERLNRLGVDLIIVGRGGGGAEELAAFNDETVVRAIAASATPVISAVGHETDFTLADLAADLRAPTPSAAAELAVPEREELLQRVREQSQRLHVAWGKQTGLLRSRLENLAARPVLADPWTFLDTRRRLVDGLNEKLQAGMKLYLEKQKSTWQRAATQLESLSPLQVLGRGYAVCTSASGQVIRSSEEVALGEHVNVLLHIGRLYCVVKDRYFPGNGREESHG